MLKLPPKLTMDQAAALWACLQPGLRAEGAQIRNAAGRVVRLNAAELQDFDSAALTLLLQAARLCKAQDLALQVHDAPPKLQELARVYGVGELLFAASPYQGVAD